MTDVMIEPLKRDLAKAGIKMELIKELDYELVAKKELARLFIRPRRLQRGKLR